MKKLLSLIFFALISFSVYAGPFGLKMGMTLDEIAEVCEEEPSLVRDDIYLIRPNKKHPLFIYYAVYVNEKLGLYQIRAISESVKCNDYGTEIQNAFNTVKDRIAKTYGNPKINNKVDPNIDSFLKESEYWFSTLEKGSRELSAVWGQNEALKDDLISVSLFCKVDDNIYTYQNAVLVLCYYFTNSKSVEDEQDDVF